MMTNQNPQTWVYFEAHRWLKRTHRRKWLLWPFVCSLLLLPVYGYGVFWGTNALTSQLTNWLGWTAQGLGYWLMLPFVLIMVLLLGYVLLKNTIMLLCAPLNALLADAAIADYLPEQAPSSASIWNSMGRAIGITTLMLALGLISTLGLMLLGSIPVVGTIAALLLGLLIQSLLTAWGLVDPVYEHLGLGIGQSFKRSLALSPRLLPTGLPFVLGFQIPVLGWTLAPSYATVAGVITASRLHRQGVLLPASPH